MIDSTAALDQSPRKDFGREREIPSWSVGEFESSSQNISSFKFRRSGIYALFVGLSFFPLLSLFGPVCVLHM